MSLVENLRTQGSWKRSGKSTRGSLWSSAGGASTKLFGENRGASKLRGSEGGESEALPSAGCTLDETVGWMDEWMDVAFVDVIVSTM